MRLENRKLPSYPQPYKVIDGCLYREVRTKNGSFDQKLCNFLPYIVSEVTIHDGTEEKKRLRLGGVRHDGSALPEIDICGNDLFTFNWLIEQWGADCILEVGKMVKDSVRYAIQQTAADADRQTVYQMTGWEKINNSWHFLMPGDSTVTVELPEQFSRYQFGSKTDPDALSDLGLLLESPPAPKETIWPLLAFTFLTPLNHFLHMADCEPKFVFLLAGRTGACKSSLIALFLSFFGRFTASDLPMSFSDTANSIIHNAFTLKDVLTCIDDYHPDGRQAEKKMAENVQAVVRAYGDRVGRGRLRADSTAMTTRSPRGNAVITAEFLPEIGESGIARCFPAELKQEDVRLSEMSFFQARASAGSYCSCMELYTNWLREKFLNTSENENRFLQMLHKTFLDYREEFYQTGLRSHRRLPEIVAWLRIGMLMLVGFLEEQMCLTRERAEEILDVFSSQINALARKQAQSVNQDKPAMIFVRKLQSLIESGQAVLLRKDENDSILPNNFVGYEDETYYYIHNDSAHKAVRALCEAQGELFTINSKALPKVLAEEGLIETAHGENTRSIRFKSQTRRVMLLPKEKFRKALEASMF